MTKEKNKKHNQRITEFISESDLEFKRRCPEEWAELEAEKRVKQTFKNFWELISGALGIGSIFVMADSLIEMDWHYLVWGLIIFIVGIVIQSITSKIFKE